ncbi:MAG: phage protein Gp27 family protein [Pseudomonadota bacterium]
MPPRRKIDTLPEDVRSDLKDKLRENGFSDYDGITEWLDERLAADGIEIRISRSALGEFGKEYQEFAKLQEQAGAWAQNWINDEGLQGEADRQNVLFKMVTSLAFKFMAGAMGTDAKEIDPKELHFIGRMLKDIMASSQLREKMMEDERAAQSLRLDEAVTSGDINMEAAQKAREILGFA